MGIFDDIVSGVKKSGIPGYSQAAGMFSGATGVGRDGEPAPAPEYKEYQYDPSAFRTSQSFGQGNQTLQRLGDMNMGQAYGDQFNSAMAAQQAAMNGTAPSVAEMQLRQGQAANAQAIQGAAGSTRGAGMLGLAQMNAANQMSAANQNVNQQAAQLRAGEMAQAREGMFAGVNQGRQAAVSGEQNQLAAYNQLANREQTRLGSAQALQYAKAKENAAKQGQARENWSNATAAAAQDEVNAQQASQNQTNTGMQAMGMFMKK